MRRPVALALSWVYDITSDGLQATDAATGGRGPSTVLMAGVIVSAIALGWVGWWGVRAVDTLGVPGGAGPVRAASIAVMPFSDMSEGGDQAFLGDGIAEEVLNVLAQVSGLQVAARTSSFAFRGDRDIREVGEQLNVATVLEGSIRRDASTVRVTAQLPSWATEMAPWSGCPHRWLITPGSTNILV